ncbi:polysaccharide deacetylase family protein [Geomesophilobacter sediminis]|uniref:Polysaccharide deacetylase family protein n=1 Tax=Geomesophilobacter sediminis TaxID=2798584 RepID=A0A8J7M332_9BACT|nr:polysaccharide deacetylase family protein [Geomesophilobacter sediminis]MBJ6727561.1 polysaccharide deacetylase family protein [Geomesophilobacter sediminis]
MPKKGFSAHLRKSVKLALLFALKLTGLFSLSRYLTRTGVRILAYHGVWLGDEGFPGDGMFMNRGTFARRFKYLQTWRYPVLALEEAVAGLRDGKLPPCAVVITIDDGWYSTYEAMLPVLQAHRIPTTLYCDTANLVREQPVPHVMARYLKMLAESGLVGTVPVDDRIYAAAVSLEGESEERLERVRRLAQSLGIDFARYFDNKTFHYMSRDQLRDAFEKGVDIQLHTHNHTLHDFSDTAMGSEVADNRRHLARLLQVEGDRFVHFCFPSGKYTRDSRSTLERLGIASSMTTDLGIAFPGDHHFLPRIMDGEHMALLELEAELCGISALLRRVKMLLSSWM